MADTPVNVLSLCSGVGGLDLGLQLAVPGARTVCYVEREAAACASLVASMEAGWFHEALIWMGDIGKFDARPFRGIVHILASGDPCQDNSVAGKRAGAAGARFLAPEVVRIADECRPDLIFRENVPGNAGEQLRALVPPLERLGYRVAAGIFSSAETGNTMRRERLFIMAEREGGDGSLQLCRRGQEQASSEFERVRSGVESPRSGRHGHSDETLRAGRDGSVDAGGPVGSAERGGNGRLPAHARREAIGRAVVDGAGGGSGEPVVRPQGIRPGESRPEHVDRANGLGRWAEGHGRRSPEDALQPGSRLPPAVIPGPTDSRWIDVLDRWPELQPALSQEEAESHLRRGIDALAHRIERLRATGNGVDPVTAAYAFLCLRGRLSA